MWATSPRALATPMPEFAEVMWATSPNALAVPMPELEQVMWPTSLKLLMTNSRAVEVV